MYQAGLTCRNLFVKSKKGKAHQRYSTQSSPRTYSNCFPHHKLDALREAKHNPSKKACRNMVRSHLLAPAKVRLGASSTVRYCINTMVSSVLSDLTER
jgi:hypothetical protein